MTTFTINAAELNAAKVVEVIASQLPQFEVTKAYSNGTGYYDRLATTVIEGDENLFGFKDEYNRYGIIVKTPIGNLVIFQRYSHLRVASMVTIHLIQFIFRSKL